MGRCIVNSTRNALGGRFAPIALALCVAWALTGAVATAAGPNLVIPKGKEGAQANDYSPIEGDEFILGAYVTNIGDQPAPLPTHVRLFLSLDNKYNPDSDYEAIVRAQVPTSEITIAPDGSSRTIKPGDDRYVQWTTSFPDLSDKEEYEVWMIVVVDTRNTVAETDENNVFVIEDTLEVGATDPEDEPDLEPVDYVTLLDATAHFLDDVVFIGDEVTIQGLFENVGGGDAPAHDVSLYLSLDQNFDPFGYPIGVPVDAKVPSDQHMPKLRPGAIGRQQWDFNFPDFSLDTRNGLPTPTTTDTVSTTSTFFYTYEAYPVFIADSLAKIEEPEEDNNTWVSTAPLTVFNGWAPDLSVELDDPTTIKVNGVYAEAEDWIVNEGDRLDVVWKIRNRGGYQAKRTSKVAFELLLGDFESSATENSVQVGYTSLDWSALYGFPKEIDALLPHKEDVARFTMTVPTGLVDANAGPNAQYLEVQPMAFLDVDETVSESRDALENIFVWPQTLKIARDGESTIAVDKNELEFFPTGSAPSAAQEVSAPAAQEPIQAEPKVLDVFDPNADPGKVLPDQIIVRFKTNSAASLHAQRLGAPGGTKAGALTTSLKKTTLQTLPDCVVGLRPFRSGEAKARMAAEADYTVAGMMARGTGASDSELQATARAVAAQAHPKGPIGLFNMQLAPGVDPMEASRQMMQRSDVLYAHPVPVCRLMGEPNDPQSFRQWYHKKKYLNMPETWDITGNAHIGVRVCVIDSGVRLSHTDLLGRTADQVDVYLENGDAYETDEKGNDLDPNDDDLVGHGTAVAGIIGGIRDNENLVAGMAPVTIIPVNTDVGEENGGGSANFEDGIYWGVDHGATVINLSLGAYALYPPQSEVEALAYAKEHDVIVCVSAGNDDGELADTQYPAAIPWSFSVAAVDHLNRRVSERNGWWWGSSYGDTVDIAAYGQGGSFYGVGDSILSLGSASDNALFPEMNGTSAASPLVAGLCALLRQINPDLSAVEVMDIIKQTAHDQIGDPDEDVEGWDPYLGYGLINPLDAVLRAGEGGVRHFRIINDGPRPLEIINISGPNGIAAKDFWVDWSPKSPFTVGRYDSRVVTVSVDFSKAPMERERVKLNIEIGEDSEGNSRPAYSDGVYIVTDPGGALTAVSLAGYVRDVSGKAISGILMTALSNGGVARTDRTDAWGYYKIDLSAVADAVEGWTGTLTPASTEYNFHPMVKSFSGLTRGVKDLDFKVSLSEQPTLWLEDFGYDQGWRGDTHLRLVADVNNDTFDDIVGFGNNGAAVSLWTDTGLAVPKVWIRNFGTDQGWSLKSHLRLLDDMDNDGKADVLGFGEKGVLVALARATGEGFEEAQRWTQDFSYQKGWRLETHPRMIADVNGDGFNDLIGFGAKGVVVGLSESDRFAAPQRWTADFGTAQGWSAQQHPRLMGDVNGDGYDDVVGFGNRGVYVALSNGSRFGDTKMWLENMGYIQGWREEMHTRMLADVNGDGRADIVGFGNSGLYAAVSNGSKFENYGLWVGAFGAADGWDKTQHPRLLGDMNGDGADDVIGCFRVNTQKSLAAGNAYLYPTIHVPGFGSDQGWTLKDHPRLLGRLGALSATKRLSIVGFGNKGVLLY